VTHTTTTNSEEIDMTNTATATKIDKNAKIECAICGSKEHHIEST
jgi:ribosomal protein L37E